MLVTLRGQAVHGNAPQMRIPHDIRQDLSPDAGSIAIDKDCGGVAAHSRTAASGKGRPAPPSVNYSFNGWCQEGNRITQSGRGAQRNT